MKVSSCIYPTLSADVDGGLTCFHRKINLTAGGNGQLDIRIVYPLSPNIRQYPTLDYDKRLHKYIAYSFVIGNGAAVGPLSYCLSRQCLNLTYHSNQCHPSRWYSRELSRGDDYRN
jgi:hypothetical protein